MQIDFFCLPNHFLHYNKYLTGHYYDYHFGLSAITHNFHLNQFQKQSLMQLCFCLQKLHQILSQPSKTNYASLDANIYPPSSSYGHRYCFHGRYLHLIGSSFPFGSEADTWSFKLSLAAYANTNTVSYFLSSQVPMCYCQLIYLKQFEKLKLGCFVKHQTYCPFR